MQWQKISTELYTDIVRSHPEKLFPVEQSPAWGEFQSQIPGRRSLGIFLLQKNEQQIALLDPMQLMMRGYSYIWINQGPTWLVEPTSGLVNEAAQAIKELVAAHAPAKPLFIRGHFPFAPKKALPAYSQSLIQKTTIVDLTQDFEQVLANMSQGARRGMRKAAKAGVTIQEVSPAEAAAQFSVYYKILSETAARDGFFVHPESTYRTMLTTLPGVVRFFAAFLQGQPIAWAIDTLYRNHAIYYYGASNEEARNVMAPYLLHIEIMRQLKEEGATTYDFLGIGSKSYPGLQGVTQFKLRFGGAEVGYVPIYDLPLSSTYHPWKWAQALKHRLRRF